MTAKTLKGAKKPNKWAVDDAPPHPSTPKGEDAPGKEKPKSEGTIVKSFSIPPSFLDELEMEAAKIKIETGKKISVSKLLVEFAREGMKK